MRGPSSERGPRGGGTWETPGTHDCCGVGILRARLALGLVRSRDPWGGRVPSCWERGAGVTQLTGWVHLPLQREVAPGALGERPLQLRPARTPTALPALEPQKRLGLSRRADQGWGAESAATHTPNLKFWFPPGGGGRWRLAGEQVGRGAAAGRPSGRGWGLAAPGRRAERAAAAAGSGPRGLREPGGGSGGSAESRGASARSPRLPPPPERVGFS